MSRAFAAVALLLTLPACSTFGGQAATSHSGFEGCTPTQPAGSGLPEGFTYGTSHLATILWPDGVLHAGELPDGGSFARVLPDGTIAAKLGWWRGDPGILQVTGERLDRTSRPLNADVAEGYGSTGFIPTELRFPAAGCWRVHGAVGDASLTFVVRVVSPAR